MESDNKKARDKAYAKGKVFELVMFVIKQCRPPSHTISYPKVEVKGHSGEIRVV